MNPDRASAPLPAAVEFVGQPTDDLSEVASAAGKRPEPDYAPYSLDDLLSGLPPLPGDALEPPLLLAEIARPSRSGPGGWIPEIEPAPAEAEFQEDLPSPRLLEPLPASVAETLASLEPGADAAALACIADQVACDADDDPGQDGDALILTDEYLAADETAPPNASPTEPEPARPEGEGSTPVNAEDAARLGAMLQALIAAEPEAEPAPDTDGDGDHDGEALVPPQPSLAPAEPNTPQDEAAVAAAPDTHPEPEATGGMSEPPAAVAALPVVETASDSQTDADEAARLAAVVEALIAAHHPTGEPALDKGDPALPERLDAIAGLLADPPPAEDFTALDLLYACWPRSTTDSPSRALLAVALNLSRNFGLPGKLPMASSKAWRMLSPSVFEEEIAQRLADVGTFIADWQKTQRTFLILEFGEIELIESLFEALQPADHLDLLAGVMNFKVLSNRRMGLLRRIPNRLKKQVTPMLPQRKDEALVIMAHTKALLERIADPSGFAPIVDTAGKMLDEVEKMMGVVAAMGRPPAAPGPGGGMPLGQIG